MSSISILSTLNSTTIIMISMRTKNWLKLKFSISTSCKSFDIFYKHHDWFNYRIKIMQNSQRCKHLTNWNIAIIMIDLISSNIDSKFKWKLFDFKNFFFHWQWFCVFIVVRMNNDLNNLYKVLTMNYIKLNKMRLMISSNRISVNIYNI